MTLLDLLAEQRIAAAIDAGEFDDLPGAGKPLDLDDDPLVPDDLRVAWRLLKNAGSFCATSARTAAGSVQWRTATTEARGSCIEGS